MSGERSFRHGLDALPQRDVDGVTSPDFRFLLSGGGGESENLLAPVLSLWPQCHWVKCCDCHPPFAYEETGSRTLSDLAQGDEGARISIPSVHHQDKLYTVWPLHMSGNRSASNALAPSQTPVRLTPNPHSTPSSCLPQSWRMWPSMDPSDLHLPSETYLVFFL